MKRRRTAKPDLLQGEWCSPTEALHSLMAAGIAPLDAKKQLNAKLDELKLRCDGGPLLPSTYIDASLILVAESDANGNWTAWITSKTHEVWEARPRVYFLFPVRWREPDGKTMTEGQRGWVHAPKNIAERAVADGIALPHSEQTKDIEGFDHVADAPEVDLGSAIRWMNPEDCRRKLYRFEFGAAEVRAMLPAPPKPRRRAGKKPEGDWPNLIRQELIRLGPKRVREQWNSGELRSDLEDFLRSKIDWAPARPTRIDEEIRAFLVTHY